MRHTAPALALALVVTGNARAELAEGPVTGELSGYAETRHQVFFGLASSLGDLSPVFPDGFHPDERYGAVERLRPTLKLHLGESATLVSTAEARTAHGFYDTRQDEIADVVSIERLYVTASSDAWDHTAGKLNLTWGSGLLLNPTDLFNDKNPADLQAERPGLWAVKSLWAANDHTNLTFAAATPETPCCAPKLIGRFDTTLGQTDLAVEAAWDTDAEAAVFGVDVRSEITLGLWLEAATTIPKAAPDAATTSFELGVDDSWDILQTLYVAVEYMYQQDGLSAPGEQFQASSFSPDALAGTTPEALVAERFRERRLFMGKHYGVALVRLEISNDWRAQVLNVTNLNDHTGLVVPQVNFLPADAFTLTLGAQLTYGPQGGEYTMTLPELTDTQAKLLPVVSPTLGPALVANQGERVSPEASVFFWGRYAF